MELRDQLQDAQDAISEAHNNSAGLKEHNRRLEAQISRLEQQLAEAVRRAPYLTHAACFKTLQCCCLLCSCYHVQPKHQNYISITIICINMANRQSQEQMQFLFLDL